LRIGSVLVEGGSNLLQQFIDAGLWDEIYRGVSLQRFVEGVAAPVLPAGMAFNASETIGIDRLEWYMTDRRGG
jgi:diaminohydroxyphosphoribosylaminopyrimidine deaminase / 5-amino-6-(5-phosphoribosylamino)uracil reductase